MVCAGTLFSGTTASGRGTGTAKFGTRRAHYQMLGKPSPDVTARTWLALEQKELLCAQLLLLRTKLLLLLAQRSDLRVVVLSARLLDLHLNLLQLRAHRLDLSHHFVHPDLVAHDEGCQEKELWCRCHEARSNIRPVVRYIIYLRPMSTNAPIWTQTD
jgi:hypothetical protein